MRIAREDGRRLNNPGAGGKRGNTQQQQKIIVGSLLIYIHLGIRHTAGPSCVATARQLVQFHFQLFCAGKKNGRARMRKQT